MAMRGAWDDDVSVQSAGSDGVVVVARETVRDSLLLREFPLSFLCGTARLRCLDAGGRSLAAEVARSVGRMGNWVELWKNG